MKDLVRPRVNSSSRYSESFRVMVVSDIVDNNLTYRSASIKYLVNQGVVCRWYKQYLPILDAIRAEIMNPKDKKRELKDQSVNGSMLELSKDLDLAKHKIRALEMLIDIAEENYQIEIRKKSGAKQ